MYLSIVSIYRYRDVIGHMIYLYFENIINDAKNGNEKSRVRGADSKATKLAERIPASKAARLAIALALAESLSASGLLSKVVIERLARRVPTIVMAFQLIGTDQKCALAARRLKTLDPKYYSILYAAQLEMLYYFVEPFLSDLIKKVQTNFYKDFDEIYDKLKSN
jgi:hypothetical protein